ncbi:MAG: DUF1365 domain-containing protein [Vicinamibacterales bacterium]
MNVPQPGVYIGRIRHRRTAPVAHAFTYPLFMVLLDIDRIPELMQVSRFTACNRWNWASFHDADHFGDPALPLRQRLAMDAAAHGHRLPDGPIFLLTHLRYAGYCFNPVSFFYCYDTAGALALVLAEVNNTFGGRHNYWLEPAPAARRAAAPHVGGDEPQTYRAAAQKSFYVSPFMAPDMAYAFAFTEPGEQLLLHMSLERLSVVETPHAFDASLELDFTPWTAPAIARALVRYPLMTAKVIAGIHWEALKLWWKGLPIVARPTPTGEYDNCAAHTLQ